MTLTAEDFAAGVPYAVGKLLVDALRTAPELAGVTVIDNPTRSSTIGDDGSRVVFYEDSVDRSKEAAQTPRARSFVFAICTINRTTDARRGAHADQRAAVNVVRSALSSVKGAAWAISKLREGDTTYRLEGLEVGGALVLTSFSIDYRDPISGAAIS